MAGKADAVKKVAGGASKVSETQEKANKVKKTAETISNNTPTSNSGEKGMKDAVVDAASAVANYYSGNYVGAAASAVEVVKNKKARKFSLVSTIISIVAPILIIVMLGLFFMQIINSIGDTVSTVVSTMSSFISGTGNWFTSLFDQTSGKLVININEDKFKELKNSLKAQAIDTEASSLTDECLKLFLLAQYKTQYPEDVIIKIEISQEEKAKIDARGRGNYVVTEDGKYYLKTSGCIELRRPEFTNGKLRYVQEETLKAYDKSTDKNFDDIKDKYSLSKSGSLIIPEKTIEKYIEGEDEGQAEWKDLDEDDDYNWENFNTRTPTKQKTTITLKQIPYQSIISPYTMPFEFLTILTTFTQNSEYGVAVAELVSNKSSILLDILDNSKTTEERYTYQYKSNSKIQYRVGAKCKVIDGAVWGHKTTGSPEIEEYKQGDLDKNISEEMLWKNEVESYEVEKPRIYRENTIKTEYTSSLQLKKAESCFLKKETGDYNIEETAKKDDTIDPNPSINKSLPDLYQINPPINITLGDYSSIQDLYDNNEQFKYFIDNIYKRDTGYNLQDFKNKLIEVFDKQKMEEFVNDYVEKNIKEQFANIELGGVPYNSNIQFSGDLAKQHDNLIKAINDYKSRSRDWKIDRNSYDIMPSFITSIKKTPQSRKAYYVSERKYNITNAGKTEDNTDEFLKLLVRNIGNRKTFVYYNSQFGGEKAPASDMLSAPDMLFELIANNKKTANMENLMRYIMYKMSGIDFGITKFDYRVYGQLSSIGGIQGATTEEKVWYALRTAGYSEYATAGVMGNIYGECGFNPALVEAGNGIGFGLCQWSFERRTNLEAYARSKNIDPSDVNTQIEFLLTELSPEEGPASGYASFIGTAGIYGCNMDGWLNATSVEEATKQFCGWFERPAAYGFYGASMYNHRIPAAIDYYNQFKGRPLSSFIAGGSGGTILECADKIHTYMEDNGYFYSCDIGLLRNTFEESKSTRAVCCASFVCWVVIDAGYLDASQMSHGAFSAADAIEAAGFIRVNENEMQAGDIISYGTPALVNGHIEIYAGDGQIYNAGGEWSIQNHNPYPKGNRTDYYKILRAPN